MIGGNSNVYVCPRHCGTFTSNLFQSTIKTSSGSTWVSKFHEFIMEIKSNGLVLDYSVKEELVLKNRAKTSKIPQKTPLLQGFSNLAPPRLNGRAPNQ